ncbi:hypothetical protein SeMB42_g00686 [Synchytrium endobioticum]|uniref:Uncharacterized protein n=1 Tax=Synchytrium endobioticum TaxID=286115 RepID=A0A507DPI2_9FUNG|nr:hypothetical protein SeMB42_g00686 [Synchytrium endobioticum]
MAGLRLRAGERKRGGHGPITDISRSLTCLSFLLNSTTSNSVLCIDQEVGKTLGGVKNCEKGSNHHSFSSNKIVTCLLVTELRLIDKPNDALSVLTNQGWMDPRDPSAGDGMTSVDNGRRVA